MVDGKQNDHSESATPPVNTKHARTPSLKQPSTNATVSTTSNGTSAGVGGATSTTSNAALSTPTWAPQFAAKSAGTATQPAQPFWPPASSSTHAQPASSGGVPVGDMINALLPDTAAAIAERERQKEAEAAYLLSWTRPRTKEDNERQQATRNRMKQLLMADRKTVHQPDIETPFQDAADVVRRLLPYHIFNHPQSELEHAIATGRRLSKGKEKEVDLPANLQALALENEETEVALDLHKQTRALKERYRKLRTREAKNAAPQDLMYWVTRTALEADREYNVRLSGLLREAQAEKDRKEREKRGIIAQPIPAAAGVPAVASTSTNPYQQAQRPAYTYQAYAPTAVNGAAYPNYAAYASSPAYQAYYQQYTAAMANARLPYGYPYGGTYMAQYPPAATPASTTASNSAGPSTATATPSATAPTIPINNAGTTGPPNTALPLSLPVSALEVLKAAGIVPVPAQNVLPSTSPQPAVILIGMSPDGSVANLTINLSLLEPEKRGQLGAVLQGLVKPAATVTATPTSSSAS